MQRPMCEKYPKSVRIRSFSAPTQWPLQYLSVFSPNAGKYWPEKLQIRTLSTQWIATVNHISKKNTLILYCYSTIHYDYYQFYKKRFTNSTRNVLPIIQETLLHFAWLLLRLTLTYILTILFKTRDILSNTTSLTFALDKILGFVFKSDSQN